VAEGETPDGEAVRVQALKNAKGLTSFVPFSAVFSRANTCNAERHLKLGMPTVRFAEGHGWARRRKSVEFVRQAESIVQMKLSNGAP
jgi:hypothetical protein